MTPERLKEWRESRNLNFKEAGKACGINPETWSRWERGKAEITPWLGHVLRSVGDGLPPYK